MNSSLLISKMTQMSKTNTVEWSNLKLKEINTCILLNHIYTVLKAPNLSAMKHMENSYGLIHLMVIFNKNQNRSKVGATSI